MAEIRLQEGESLENALRRFKRKVQSEDIIKEVKRHSYYLKPGEKRRVKQALARKRARKRFEKKVHLRRTRVGNNAQFRRVTGRLPVPVGNEVCASTGLSGERNSDAVPFPRPQPLLEDIKAWK